MRIHKGLTDDRWFAFSVAEQLANVGADIGRTIQGNKKSDFGYARQAFDRALELLDLTIKDPKNKRQRREIFRVREALLDHFLYDNEYNTTDESWDQYFYWFNAIASLERKR